MAHPPAAAPPPSSGSSHEKRSVWEKILSGFGILHVFSEALGYMRSGSSISGTVSHATTAVKDVGIVVQGLQGMFGFGDEREWQQLLIELEKLHPGLRGRIERFVMWHFASDGTFLGDRAASIFQERFRTFITQMDKDPQGTPAEARNQGAKKFLIWMNETIKAEGSTELKNFEKVLYSMKAGNVPTFPIATIATLRAIEARVREDLPAANTQLQERIAAEKKKLGFFGRLLP